MCEAALVGVGLPASCVSVVDPQCIAHMTGIEDEAFLASASDANMAELRVCLQQIKEAAAFYQQSVAELYQKRDDLEFKMCNYRNTSGVASSRIRDYADDDMVETDLPSEAALEFDESID